MPSDPSDTIKVAPAPPLPDLGQWKQNTTHALVLRVAGTSKVDKNLDEYNRLSAAFNEKAKEWNEQRSRRYTDQLRQQANGTDTFRARHEQFGFRETLRADFKKTCDAYTRLQNAVSDLKPDGEYLQTFKRLVGDAHRDLDTAANSLQRVRDAMEGAERGLIEHQQQQLAQAAALRSSSSQSPSVGGVQRRASDESFVIGRPDSRASDESFTIGAPSRASDESFSVGALRRDSGDSHSFSIPGGESRPNSNAYSFSIPGGVESRRNSPGGGDSSESMRSSMESLPEYGYSRSAAQRRPDHGEAGPASPSEPQRRSRGEEAVARAPRDTAPLKIVKKKPLGRGAG